SVHFGGFKVKRDQNNKITEILSAPMQGSGITSEAPIYIEIDRLVEEKSMSELQADIDRVFEDVRVSVADWRKMVSRVEDSLAELEKTPKKLDTAEVVEARDFLRWLINNN